jgi:hypothetical protein
VAAAPNKEKHKIHLFYVPILIMNVAHGENRETMNSGDMQLPIGIHTKPLLQADLPLWRRKRTEVEDDSGDHYIGENNELEDCAKEVA